jgi:hypothetical protein
MLKIFWLDSKRSNQSSFGKIDLTVNIIGPKAPAHGTAHDAENTSIQPISAKRFVKGTDCMFQVRNITALQRESM